MTEMVVETQMWVCGIRRGPGLNGGGVGSKVEICEGSYEVIKWLTWSK